MGRTNKERNIKVYYTKEVIAGWNKLTPVQKEIFNKKGRPFGYSGMNVFVFTLIVYCFFKFLGANPNKFFWAKLY